MYELEDVKSYIQDKLLELILEDERIEKLYKMISNPELRVKDKDEKWVAYTSQASEDTTVVDAIRKILIDELPSREIPLKKEVEDAVDEVGTIFETMDISHKPRIPFYVLVLDKLVK
ncbi:hypothetical protein [Sulfurospirillum sp. MES]|uniref:hypothetical protein n=1 Tax=Sulfurospirillum sp. MES TaxID=1565314 RepID=UPI000541D689|nr:hypothetical protein [Sulfurospirillum sp. MES]KHG33177.1 MAG: hypothetical protein OA34_11405 [Sulfurospirillum sp. MES]